MNLKILSLVAAMLLVAGCSQSSTDTDNTKGGGQTTAQATSGGSPQEQITKVGNTVYFAFDRSDITSEGRATLQRQAQLLQQNPSWTVTIQGNCDERGTVEYNLGLGERRANAARQALIALGVAANRVQIISYGKERPAVAGHNEQAWAQNRRAVTVVN